MPHVNHNRDTQRRRREAEVQAARQTDEDPMGEAMREQHMEVLEGFETQLSRSQQQNQKLEADLELALEGWQRQVQRSPLTDQAYNKFVKFNDLVLRATQSQLRVYDMLLWIETPRNIRKILSLLAAGHRHYAEARIEHDHVEEQMHGMSCGGHEDHSDWSWLNHGAAFGFESSALVNGFGDFKLAGSRSVSESTIVEVYIAASVRRHRYETAIGHLKEGEVPQDVQLGPSWQSDVHIPRLYDAWLKEAVAWAIDEYWAQFESSRRLTEKQDQLLQTQSWLINHLDEQRHRILEDEEQLPKDYYLKVPENKKRWDEAFDKKFHSRMWPNRVFLQARLDRYYATLAATAGYPQPDPNPTGQHEAMETELNAVKQKCVTVAGMTEEQSEACLHELLERIEPFVDALNAPLTLHERLGIAYHWRRFLTRVEFDIVQADHLRYRLSTAEGREEYAKELVGTNAQGLENIRPGQAKDIARLVSDILEAFLLFDRKP
ncbi:hypothetical protein H2203_000462 [Taxawa tesnikishii (nom. ined.)]|nr:hypothetical protein H2203_000462 [Dothideales sp. JES 119]